MFMKTLPVTHYTEKEHEEIEAMYMGTSSKARMRLQRNSFNRGRRNSFNRGRGNSYNRGQSRDRSKYSRYNGYNPRSRYDSYRVPGGQNDSTRHDQSRSQNDPQTSTFPRCIACRCRTCYLNTKMCEEKKRLILEKFDVKKVDAPPDYTFSTSVRKSQLEKK